MVPNWVPNLQPVVQCRVAKKLRLHRTEELQCSVRQAKSVTNRTEDTDR